MCLNVCGRVSSKEFRHLYLVIKAKVLLEIFGIISHKMSSYRRIK